MEVYGFSATGKVLVEVLDEKPIFSTCDCGRIIYTTDDEAFYGGSNDTWVYIAGKSGAVAESDIMWGFDVDEVNADSIPFDTINTNFDASVVSTVRDAINALSDGTGICDGAIQTEHLSNDSITPDAINFGYGGTHVQASSIPCTSKVASLTTTKTNIQEAIELIENSMVYRKNYSIDTNQWTYDSTEDLYCCTLIFDSYIGLPPLVQCIYNNAIIIPAKIKFYSSVYKVKIYMVKAYKLDVTILG